MLVLLNWWMIYPTVTYRILIYINMKFTDKNMIIMVDIHITHTLLALKIVKEY